MSNSICDALLRSGAIKITRDTVFFNKQLGSGFLTNNFAIKNKRLSGNTGKPLEKLKFDQALLLHAIVCLRALAVLLFMHTFVVMHPLVVMHAFVVLHVFLPFIQLFLLVVSQDGPHL